MYALADCNNFFASCERVFRPERRTLHYTTRWTDLPSVTVK